MLNRSRVQVVGFEKRLRSEGRAALRIDFMEGGDAVRRRKNCKGLSGEVGERPGPPQRVCCCAKVQTQRLER